MDGKLPLGALPGVKEPETGIRPAFAVRSGCPLPGGVIDRTRHRVGNLFVFSANRPTAVSVLAGQTRVAYPKHPSAREQTLSC